MDPNLEALCDELDELSARVLAAWNENRTLKEVQGWQYPALTRHDLAALASGLAQSIRDAGSEDVEQPLATTLEDFPRRLKLLYSDTVPHMFNGNGVQAVPPYIETLVGLTGLLRPLIGWAPNPENRAMPAPMARRLRTYQATIDSLAPDAERLRAQISQIEAATEAAEHLPTDLHDLAEARKKVDRFATDAAELYGKLDERAKEVNKLAGQVKAKEEEAAKLVEQCEQAYRITTTKGLAAAFDQRAFKIAFSMWVWVLGLLAALIAATYLGAERVKVLSDAMAGTDPKWGIILLQAILSLLSVGAPLWFGWVATKQIAQRFRLAEDYGFKASVAKAYEGYRREAARLDPELERRLFSSALTRLEEPPLRLVTDHSDYGSPAHEAINSPTVRDALRTVPNFKDGILKLAEKALDTVRGTSSQRDSTTPASAPTTPPA